MGRDGTETAHAIEVAEAGPTRRIAVRVRDGAGPSVVWLGGFRSDMGATKAEALDAWARQAGRRFVRFDYTGHGRSGGTFAESTISTWLADALAVLDAHVPGPAVLVGSSMGGWIACLAALSRIRRGAAAAAGLVLIAPALDFTQDLLWDRLPPEVQGQLEREGVWMRQSAYAPEPDPLSMALIADGRSHCLLGAPFEPGCPVHILQGMQDPDVPYAHALRTVARLPAAGTVLTLIADGDHRLSRPGDIDRLIAAVAGIA